METGKKDIIDFTKDRIVKLPWKIDWPMRWDYEKVNFEPGGPDHASPGSSYDVSGQISLEIFKRDPPDFQAYQFIKIKGQKSKMSSSSGEVITPKELLNVYPPELIRFIYARYSPTSQLDIALDKDVIRAYSEFDTHIKEIDEEFKTLIFNPFNEELTQSIPFRKILGLGESTGYNLEKINEILLKEDEKYSKRSIEDRLKKSDYWSKKYYPEARSELRDSFNLDYYNSLPDESKDRLLKLNEILFSKENLSLEGIEVALYRIPKKEGMSDSEMKSTQKEFFNDIYHLLFDKSTGPRLPTYFWALDNKDKLKKLLKDE